MLPLLCLLAGLAATVTGACVAPFTVVGEGCYYLSAEDDISMAWGDARQYCLSLGSEVDLAMLDYVCDDFRNLGSYYRLLGTTNGYTNTWIGATGTGDTWYWVDGRSFSTESPYWRPGYPTESNECATMIPLIDEGRYRIYVGSIGSINVRPFICQDFSAASAVQQ